MIERLLEHPLFDPLSPNSIRAVLGGLASNINTFHMKNGEGYMFMANQIYDVDKRNPITASRLVKVFSSWKSLNQNYKIKMFEAIEYLNNKNLSSNTKEVIDLIIK